MIQKISVKNGYLKSRNLSDENKTHPEHKYIHNSGWICILKFSVRNFCSKAYNYCLKGQNFVLNTYNITRIVLLNV